MLLCRLLGHPRPDRRRVWNDGLNYRASCSRCAAPLIKDGRTRRWRPFVSEDHNHSRSAKPERPHA